MLWKLLIISVVLALLPYILGGILSACVLIYAVIAAIISMIKDKIEHNKRQ